MVTTRREAHLVAFDLLDGALAADGLTGAEPVIRADLEVLSREQLIAVAMAVVLETAFTLTPRATRSRLVDRVQERRLEVMVADG